MKIRWPRNSSQMPRVYSRTWSRSAARGLSSILAAARRRQAQGVAHQLQTSLILRRQNRLRVKLHHFNGKLAMANAHDDAVIRTRRHFQAVRKALRNSVE